MKNNCINKTHKLFAAILKIILFVVVLSLVFFSFTSVFRFKYGDGIYGMDKFYELENNTVDVLILGSSHAFEDINPAVLYSYYGISSFDLCGSVQPMWNTYHYLIEALKTQSPKLVVLEAFCTKLDFNYSDSSRIIKNNYGLKFSLNMIESLKASVPEGEFFDYFFKFYQYHNRYAEDLTKSDFAIDKGQVQYKNWKGFGCNFAHTSFNQPNVDAITTQSALNEKTEIYYRKIIELCNKNNIPLEIIITPYIVSENDQKKFNKASEIAAEYNIPFINFNSSKFYSDIGMDFSLDMADEGHLNYHGNIKFSQFYGEHIKTNYDIPDRRNSIKWTSWEENAEYFWQTIENKNLKGIIDITQYLTSISECENYIATVSVVGDCNKAYEKLLSYLNIVGVHPDTYDINKTWIIKKSEVIMEYDESNENPFLKLDDVTIDLCEKDVVKINGDIKKVVNNGINIIIYDCQIKDIIDIVGFDMNNNFSAKR